MKKILIVLAIIIVSLLTFYWYIGGFESLEVKKGAAGGYLVAGLNHTGAYHTVGTTMEKADSMLRSIGIECTKGFGIYYDNPEATPEEELRSYVGNIIENADQAQIENMKAAGLRVDSIANKNALIVEMKTRSNLSYMIGPMKAYPLLNEKVKSEGCTPSLAFEIYDVPAKKAFYIMHCE